MRAYSAFTATDMAPSYFTSEGISAVSDFPHGVNGRRGRDFANQFAGTSHVPEPSEELDRHAHAILYAASFAFSSSGAAAAPSSQTSPPSKYSCFQIGTICLTRSMA